MVEPKESFEAIHPCEFYRPADIMEPELMYTVPEIGRLLQGLEPEAVIEPETEAILVEWAVPWIMVNAAELVIADPTDEEQPGHYGLRIENGDA